MSDGVLNATPAGSPAPAASQPEAVAPATQPSPTPASPQGDDRLARLQDNVRGLSQLANPMIERGLKTPDQIKDTLSRADRYGQLEQAAQARNMTVDQLVGLLSAGGSPAAPAQPAQAAPQGPDLDAMIVRALDRTLTEREAKSGHRQAETAQATAIEGMVSKFTGIGIDKRVVAAIVDKSVRDNRQLYPADHPLRDDAFVPLSTAQIAAIETEIAEALGVTAAGIQGKEMVQQARSILNATPASGSALQTGGQPAQPARQSRDQRVAEAQAILQKHMAAVGGGAQPMR